MDIVTGLVVGLIAALLSRAFIGPRAFDSLFRDLLTGVAGALLARWLFVRLAYAAPIPGEPGVVLVAALGAAALLAFIRVFRFPTRLLW
ncbi:MAG: GlsB/YeaQ/YmgE family stress response membrane protein [Proteobacteria bacterium]|nr:GlsB/YeaQ/YmgE family stress response membrane protein [Pseudomonadota bacterium]